jgi:hypothetical protein
MNGKLNDVMFWTSEVRVLFSRLQDQATVVQFKTQQATQNQFMILDSVRTESLELQREFLGLFHQVMARDIWTKKQTSSSFSLPETPKWL